MVLATLDRMRGNGRTITLPWIPNHMGLPGNEKADAAARRALTQDQFRIQVPLSLQQLKRLAKDYRQIEIVPGESRGRLIPAMV